MVPWVQRVALSLVRGPSSVFMLPFSFPSFHTLLYIPWSWPRSRFFLPDVSSFVGIPLSPSFLLARSILTVLLNSAHFPHGGRCLDSLSGVPFFSPAGEKTPIPPPPGMRLLINGWNGCSFLVSGAVARSRLVEPIRVWTP